MKDLVIIESPNKIATIQKYLGSDYIVTSSSGHFLEMKKTGKDNLGIDFEKWEPIYKLDASKKNKMDEISKLIKKSKTIFIATDPDREGEAIAENLLSYYKIDKKYKRLKYNEITKEAVLNSIKSPTLINYDLVFSQKARRMIDRIIGFKCSSLLRAKIKNNQSKLSGGRVQTIFLKLIVKKEDEILNFVPVKYSLIEGVINDDTVAKYYNDDSIFDSKEWIERDKVNMIYNNLKGDLEVISAKTSQKLDAKITPLKQATVYKKSPYSATNTSRIMQNLFEGFGDSSGLISYPRTDSTRLSTTFLAKAKSYITSKYGKEYVSNTVRGFSGDQDAHEAIRPTDISLTPEKARQKFSLSSQEFNIYQIIYNTTLKAIMSQPKKEIISYKLANNGHNFKLSYSKILFDGYLILSGSNYSNKELPKYEIGKKIPVKKYVKTDNETKPPARFNEGSLIAKMDELKIGRPSTYASSIKTNLDREYVIKEGQSLIPTKLGRVVLQKLDDGFPKQFQQNYTSILEAELEMIAEGKNDYKNTMENFWINFNSTLKTAQVTLEKTFLLPKIYEGKMCPKDGAYLIERKNSRDNSTFIGCQNYPKCNYTLKENRFFSLKRKKGK